MVENVIDDFDKIRERFERLLRIPENERRADNLFELMRLTAKFKIFESFKMSEMHKEICRKIYLKSYERGQIIFKQGDDGDAYYFVLRGCVDLYMYDIDQTNGKTKLKYLASVLPSNGFGELALLYDCPRTATAIPNSNTDLIVFKKKLYNTFVKDLHEKDLLDLVRFYYSIPIFKNEPISNILKYCLRTNKKRLNAFEPFIKYLDYTDEYQFVKQGVIKAYVRIKVNKYLIRNAHFMKESSFIEQIKNMQIKYNGHVGESAVSNPSRTSHIFNFKNYKKTHENHNYQTKDLIHENKQQDSHRKEIYEVYEEILDIMQFVDKEMFAEYYSAQSKRLDIYFLPVLPTEIITIKTDELKKINPSLNEAIKKFSCPIFDADRVFKKLYQTLLWKENKSKLLNNLLNKKD
jgi:hypothetical protein